MCASPGRSSFPIVSTSLRQSWTKNRLAPLWESSNAEIGCGGPSEDARIWHWSDVRPVLLETAKLVDPSIFERRVLQLVGATGGAGMETTAGTLNGTLQAMMSGEVARPHRHTMNALRFILEGEGAETVVDGACCPMFPGDLITTPAMTWHEHENRTDAAALWLDVLDATLMRRLGVAAFEPGPAVTAATALEGASTRTSGIPARAPDTAAAPQTRSFRYPWAGMLNALARAPARSDGSREVRYVEPATGGPCISLIDCSVIEIPAGTATTAVRTAANAICSVVEGEGVSVLGETVLHWAAKDTFTIPQHTWFTHRTSGRLARIFVASNREVYRRLGLLTEESRVAEA